MPDCFEPPNGVRRSRTNQELIHTTHAAPQPAGGGHEWLRVEQHTRGSGTLTDVAYVPRMCNHCDDAPCVKAGDGAVRKRDDGIGIIATRIAPITVSSAVMSAAGMPTG